MSTELAMQLGFCCALLLYRLALRFVGPSVQKRGEGGGPDGLNSRP